jgi:hypothetical protein
METTFYYDRASESKTMFEIVSCEKCFITYVKMYFNFLVDVHGLWKRKIQQGVHVKLGKHKTNRLSIEVDRSHRMKSSQFNNTIATEILHQYARVCQRKENDDLIGEINMFNTLQAMSFVEWHRWVCWFCLLTKSTSIQWIGISFIRNKYAWLVWWHSLISNLL